MPAPDGSSDMTGRTQYRETWTGRLVLQVEMVDYRRKSLGDPVPTYWRDAKERQLRSIKYFEGLTDEQRTAHYLRSLG